MADMGQWRDVTSLCENAAASLKMDELLSAPTFSLFDSMSALELMDPKMDSAGCEMAQTLAEMVQAGMAPLTVTPGDALRLCDKLLACEVAWADGGAVAETVMSCLYAHDVVFAELREVDTPAAAALAACVACSLRYVHLGRSMVVRADIYEEEDFCPSRFGLSAAPQDLDEDALCEIADAKVDGMLREHLRYRRNLVRALVVLESSSEEEEEDELLLNVLLENSAASLKRMEELDSEENDVGEEAPNFGFDAGACRCLPGASSRGQQTNAGGCRHASAQKLADRRVTREAAAKTIRGLQSVRDLRACIRSLSRPSDDPSGEHGFARLQRCIRCVQGDKNGRCVIPRSLAALELGGDGASLRGIPADDAMAFAATKLGGSKSVECVAVLDLVAESMISCGVPQCALGTKSCSAFCLEASRAVLDALRLGCSNRARHKSRSGPLLQDWAQLCMEGERADSLIAQELGIEGGSTAVGAWALRCSLDLMMSHISLQLELELYSSHYELEALHWYWEYLLSAQMRLGKATRAGRVALRDELKRGNNHRGQPPPLSDMEKLADLRDDAVELVRTAHRSACRASQRLASANGENAPTVLYTSWERRFAHRFFPFAPFAPFLPTVTHTEYEQLTAKTRRRAPADQLTMASEEFAVLKMALDRAMKMPEEVLHVAGADRAGLFKLARVAVANRVSIARTLRDFPDAPGDFFKITFDYGAHEHFPRIVAVEPGTKKKKKSLSSDSSSPRDSESPINKKEAGR